MPKKHTTASGLLAQLAERIKPSQLAKRFAIKVATLQRWLKRGIPPTKVARVELTYARSERSRKAAATRKREREIFTGVVAPETGVPESVIPEPEIQPEKEPVETPETRELRKRLQGELGSLAVSEQLMRRLETEFKLEQPAWPIVKEKIKVVAEQIKALPGRSIYDVLAEINESDLEKRKWKLIEEFGLHNQRELYTLYHYNNSPKYGAVAI